MGEEGGEVVEAVGEEGAVGIRTPIPTIRIIQIILLHKTLHKSHTKEVKSIQIYLLRPAGPVPNIGKKVGGLRTAVTP